MGTTSKGSGSRKHGRDKIKCARYRARHLREINKIKKLTKLLLKAQKLDWKNPSQFKAAIDRAKAKKAQSIVKPSENITLY